MDRLTKHLKWFIRKVWFLILCVFLLTFWVEENRRRQQLERHRRHLLRARSSGRRRAQDYAGLIRWREERGESESCERLIGWERKIRTGDFLTPFSLLSTFEMQNRSPTTIQIWRTAFMVWMQIWWCLVWSHTSPTFVSYVRRFYTKKAGKERWICVVVSLLHQTNSKRKEFGDSLAWKRAVWQICVVTDGKLSQLTPLSEDRAKISFRNLSSTFSPSLCCESILTWSFGPGEYQMIQPLFSTSSLRSSCWPPSSFVRMSGCDDMMLLLTVLPYRFSSDKISFKYDLERVIDDFVFMCFFIGNDFLPNLPSIDISEGGLDVLFDLYSCALMETDGYLCHEVPLHLSSSGVSCDISSYYSVVTSSHGHVHHHLFVHRLLPSGLSCTRESSSADPSGRTTWGGSLFWTRAGFWWIRWYHHRNSRDDCQRSAAAVVWCVA